MRRFHWRACSFAGIALSLFFLSPFSFYLYAQPPASAIQQTTLEASKLATPPPDNLMGVRIRARVNGKAILEEEINESYRPILRSLSPAEREAEEKDRKIWQRALDSLIDQELLLQDLDARFAKKRPQYLEKLRDVAGKEFDKHIRARKADIEKQNGIKIESDADLKKILRAQGMTLQGYRRNFERDFMAKEYVRAIIYPAIMAQVDRRQIVEYYEQHKDAEYKTENRFLWQDLFLDAERFRSREEAGRLASQITAQARAGTDFKSLILKYDQGLSAFNQGKGVWNREGEIQPAELEPVLKRLRIGEVSPPVEVTNGFHVVCLLQREVKGHKLLDDKVQAEIRKKLQNEAAIRESQRIVSELKRKAEIEIIKE